MPKAKYEGIYRSIKQRIEALDYPYQTLLPAESELIREYDCARNTLRRALADLTSDGYLQPIQGKGVRVIYRPVGRTAFRIGVIESFRETAARNHLRAVTKVVSFEPTVADERLASQSGFMVGEPLWAIERVRYLDGKALILDCNYFSQEMIPGLNAEIAAGSIYDYIEKDLKLRITTTKRRVTMDHATTRDRALLDLDDYDGVVVVSSLTFDADGLLFEYTQSRHQPAYFCFEDTATRRRQSQSQGEG